MAIQKRNYYEHTLQNNPLRGYIHGRKVYKCPGTTVLMGYTGHQSIRRISGNQIQPIQRRSIQKPQHSTGRNGGRTERRKHTQSGRLRQFLSKRKFL